MSVDYNSFIAKTGSSNINLDKFLGTGYTSYLSDEEKRKQQQAQELQQAQLKIQNQLGDTPDLTNPMNRMLYSIGQELGNAYNKTVVKGAYNIGKKVADVAKNPTSVINPAINTVKNIAEGTYNPLSLLTGNSEELVNKIKAPMVESATQDILGKKYSIEEWNKAKDTLPKEYVNAVNAKIGENITSSVASVATSPVRFTAGSLATLATSYAMEKTDYNGKYTPQTDAEKLLIGEDDIQRLTKQNDLYGTIAKSLGTPTALAVGAILENPFIAGTGVGPVVERTLKEKFAKEAVSKMGFREFINIVDDAMKTKVEDGVVSKEAAETIMKDITNIKITPAETKAPEEGAITDTSKLIESTSRNVNKTSSVSGEGFTMANPKESDVKGSKLYNKFIKDNQKFSSNPTKETLDSAIKSRDNYREYINSKNVTPEKTTLDNITPEKTTLDNISKTTTPYEVTNKETFVPKQIQEIAKDAMDKYGEEFPNLPEVSKVHKAEQQELVANLWNTDKQRMIDIAMGKDNVKPGDPLPESIYLFVKDYANKSDDVNLIKDLGTATNSVGYKTSELAQRLSMLNQGDTGDVTGDAVKNIQNVVSSKIKSAEKKFGNIDKATDKIVNEMSDVVNKTVINKDDWKSFVDSIKC